MPLRRNVRAPAESLLEAFNLFAGDMSVKGQAMIVFIVLEIKL